MVREKHWAARRCAVGSRALLLVVVWLSQTLSGARAVEGSGTPQDTRSVTIARETYRGWPDTYRLSNGLIEARVVTAIGPRVIDLRLAGGANLFHVREGEVGGSGEPHWVFRGGWRLWVAPERLKTTYALDNAPCEAAIEHGTALRVVAPPQPAAGIRKELEVTVAVGEPRLRLISHIRNMSDHPITYAPWSLSVMRPGGRAFVPLDVGEPTAFDATRRLLLWSYSKFDDPRYRFGDRLIQIDHAKVQPPPAGQPGRGDDESKIGVDSAQGWAGYLLDGTLYLKRFPHDAAGRYPDGGATIEVYSSREFLELENLGPLTTIAPGEEIVLPEDWWLFSGVEIDREDPLAELQRYVGRARFPQGITSPPS